jgi:type IV secretory pathway VirB10-like protein
MPADPLATPPPPPVERLNRAVLVVAALIVTVTLLVVAFVVSPRATPRPAQPAPPTLTAGTPGFLNRPPGTLPPAPRPPLSEQDYLRSLLERAAPAEPQPPSPFAPPAATGGPPAPAFAPPPAPPAASPAPPPEPRDLKREEFLRALRAPLAAPLPPPVRGQGTPPGPAPRTTPFGRLPEAPWPGFPIAAPDLAGEPGQAAALPLAPEGSGAPDQALVPPFAEPANGTASRPQRTPASSSAAGAAATAASVPRDQTSPHDAAEGAAVPEEYQPNTGGAHPTGTNTPGQAALLAEPSPPAPLPLSPESASPPVQPQAAARSLTLRRPGALGALPDGDATRPVAGYPGGLAVAFHPPPPPTTLAAGTLIPAQLETEVNSDLAGPVLAQVSRDVYDLRQQSVVVPAGTRLLGRYENRVAVGQRRLLVAWTRMTFPDGSAFDFPGLPGTDPAGSAGLGAHVQNHLLRLFGDALLLSLLSAGADLSQPASRNLTLAPSAGSVASAAAGQELSSVGLQLLRRDLAIQPTLRLAAGTPFLVFVNGDLPLARPFPGAPGAPGESPRPGRP